MADEPNKKMDEMLRDYAEERRKAPELYLHPATRKMLQGEVSRVIGKGEARRTWVNRLRSFWPQIAFGGALCFVLGIATLSLREAPTVKAIEDQDLKAVAPLPSFSDTELSIRPADEMRQEAMAENEKRLNESLGQIGEKKEQPVPAPDRVELQARPETVVKLGRDAESEVLRRDGPAAQRPAIAPVRSGTDKSDGVSLGVPAVPKNAEPSRGVEADLYSIAPAPPTVVPQKTEPFQETKTLDAAAGATPESLQKKAVSSTRAAQLPSLRAQPASPPAERGLGLQDLGAARRFHFVQATNSAAASAVPLFTSFQMEQSGNDVRMLDRDGSVYYGIIEAQTNPPSEPNLSFGVVRQRVLEASPKPTNAAEFNITVRGTNVTLGKDVVLTGQMFERTNTGQTPVDRLAPARTASRATGRRPGATEPRMMIIGNAVVGRTNEVPVRAYSREP